MEEVITHDGEFLLTDDEKILNSINELNGQYSAKLYKKIFETNLYVGIDYRFNPVKLLSLLVNYENKYSVDKEYSPGFSFRHYDAETNGGVFGIDYQSLLYEGRSKAQNSDGTLSLAITIEADCGYVCEGVTKNDGIFEVLLFKYNIDSPNTCIYAKFTTKEKLKEFFIDLQSCVVSIDEKGVFERAKIIQDSIIEETAQLRDIQSIMDTLHT